MKELVSVVMTSYNGEVFIEQQIKSILKQTYTDIELIIVDDLSTDSTFSLLKAIAERDDRIRLYQNHSNLGFVANFEKALSLAKGNFIALADQDDVWEATKIEVLLENIGNNSLIHSDCSLINEKNTVISPSWKGGGDKTFNFKYYLFANDVTGCTCMFTKKLLDKVLPFPSGLAYHDWWLAICAASDNRLKYISLPLIRYRQHLGQDTGVRKGGVLSKIFAEKVSRFHPCDNRRASDLSKQKDNLISALSSERFFSDEQLTWLNEALLYCEDYLSNRYFHPIAFKYSLKYSQYLYSKSNPLYFRNLYQDLIL